MTNISRSLCRFRKETFVIQASLLLLILTILALQLRVFYREKQIILWHPPNESLALFREKIPSNAECFRWMKPEWQKTVASESNAIWLNYYLWPRRILYRDDKAILSMEWVICNSSDEEEFQMRTLEHEFMSGKEQSFEVVARSGEMTLMKRAGQVWK